MLLSATWAGETYHSPDSFQAPVSEENRGVPQQGSRHKGNTAQQPSVAEQGGKGADLGGNKAAEHQGKAFGGTAMLLSSGGVADLVQTRAYHMSAPVCFSRAHEERVFWGCQGLRILSTLRPKPSWPQPPAAMC